LRFFFFGDRPPSPIPTVSRGSAVAPPLLLWDHLEALVQRCRTHERCALFLDFDGTLAPIVEDPAAARMPPATHHTLTTLAQHPRYHVSVVSGRALADLRTRVGVSGLYLAGNHGLEIEGPGSQYVHPNGGRLRPRLDALCQVLQEDLRGIPAAWVEDKGLTLSVHFRRVPAADVPAVKACLLRRVAPGVEAGCLALRTGKAVLEVRPQVQWSKGEAVQWILERIRLGGLEASVLPLYIGDDDTDEDAFQVLASSGVGIVVGTERRGSAAHYAVESTEGVTRVLAALSTLPRPRS
jgi:trehalose 6-phosphate phosphatase